MGEGVKGIDPPCERHWGVAEWKKERLNKAEVPMPFKIVILP